MVPQFDEVVFRTGHVGQVSNPPSQPKQVISLVPTPLLSPAKISFGDLTGRGLHHDLVRLAPHLHQVP
jgi:hypothetical protein